MMDLTNTLLNMSIYIMLAFNVSNLAQRQLPLNYTAK